MILLTKKDCGKCDKIKALLKTRNVAYREKDYSEFLEVSHEDENLDLLTLLSEWEMLGGDMPILIDHDHCEAGYINIKNYIEEKK